MGKCTGTEEEKRTRCTRSCNSKNISANVVVEIVGITVAGRGCYVVVVFVVVVFHHGNSFLSVFLSFGHGPALDFSFGHEEIKESASDDDSSADEEDDAPFGFRALRKPEPRHYGLEQPNVGTYNHFFFYDFENE